MQAQWCLVDRSRSKRSNDEGSDISSKRQRRVRFHLESSDECEDLPQIRGGMARPPPPQLGPPPSRATNTSSQANKTTPTGSTPAPTSTPRSKITIVESDDDDDDEDWRPRKKAPTQPDQPGTTGGVVNTTGVSNTSGQPPGLTGIQGTSKSPNQPPQVGTTTTPLQPVQVPSHLPTPPQTGPSNKKQGVQAGAGTSTGVPGGTTPATTPATAPTTTPRTTTVTLPPYPEESEILALYGKLQEMVYTWVEECLPDTFPEEFKTQRPERYWELCGWCQPYTLGGTMLSDRAWAKYVYESWVWRFFHQEIFRPGSVTWAGNDLPREAGGANGVGRSINNLFANLYDSDQRTMTPEMYLRGIRQRAGVMQLIREGFVTRERRGYDIGWLVTEMLVAFHPYFSDSYKPIDQPQNIEVLLRDTRFLIVKARELDDKLRSARHLYDLILGREGEDQGDVCRISGVESPAVLRYEAAHDQPRPPIYFDEDTLLALIVVPGLIRFGIEEDLYGTDDKLTKSVVRHARAFAQSDLLLALSR